jgi:hypothetical protein
MKKSSCYGGQIQVDKGLILVIWADIGHFFEEENSGRFTGVSGGGFRETEPDLGLF